MEKASLALDMALPSLPPGQQQMATWKERLADRMPTDLAREIDVYEGQIDLKKHGKIEDKLFAEARLRRGSYGQRYDNGQRHDGIAHQTLPFPTQATKGVD